MKNSILTALPIVVGTLAAAALSAQQRETETTDTARDLHSLLRVPTADYRRDWVHLGTFSVLADDPAEGAKELHTVYAGPGAVEAYRQTGAFPDGAVIVKDVFEAASDDLTTGRASYAGTLAGRFVMVKDSANTLAGQSPLWGDGWGWAFYPGSATTETSTTDYVEDCLACHEPARAQDFLYVQGYPVLQ